METIKTLKIEAVRAMFLADTEARKANKSANEVILHLLDLVPDTATITAEMGKGGTLLNRGSVAECVIKLWLKGQKSATKMGAGKADLILNGTRYEIKCSTSKGYATYRKGQHYENLIFVNQYGIYLVDGRKPEALVLDGSAKHIKDINMSYVKKTLATW